MTPDELPKMGELSVKSVVMAVEHFLSAPVDHVPEGKQVLTIQGVADEHMSVLLEKCGGKIKVEISAIPADLMKDVVRELNSPTNRPAYSSPLEEFEAKMAEAAGR